MDAAKEGIRGVLEVLCLQVLGLEVLLENLVDRQMPIGGDNGPSVGMAGHGS